MTDHGGKRIGMGQMGSVPGPGDLDQLRVRRVFHQPGDRLTVAGGRVLTPSKDGRDSQRR